MVNRVQRLAALLPEGIDCAVITSEENQAYFLNFTASNGTLVVGRDFSCYITDSRYIIAAEESAGSLVDECVLQTKGLSGHLAEFFASHSVRTAAFEGTKVSAFNAKVFADKLEGVAVDFSGMLDKLILMSMRRTKDKDELARIKAAQKITDEAFSHILGFIKPGVTERQIALELDYFMLSHGADALSFETIAVSGENGAKPHGVPGSRQVQSGEFVTMDFGAVVDFYHSDMTRTVCVGKPTEEMRRVYDTVLLAQRSARKLAGAGVPCADVDAAARYVIKQAGYGEFFGHSTGHGVGVEIHEQPNFSASSKEICTPGDVITDEPGIYLPGRFGVRIEDMLVITEGETLDLTQSDSELIIL